MSEHTLIDLYVRSKAFQSQTGQSTQVLQNVHITLNKGEFCCLTGPSGSGKTTLLNILSGLDENYDGKHQIDTANTKIAYVFQEPCLLPWKTVRKNLELVMPQKNSHKIEEILNELKISDCVDYFPNQLSLGMARRVSIGRALLYEADIVLLDEPLVSLDNHLVDALQDMLIRLWNKYGLTVLLVTHDIRQAVRLGQRLNVLSGNPATIISQTTYDTPYNARNHDWIETKYNEFNSRITLLPKTD